MARNSFFSDYLQSYPFWLFDVAPIDSFGLPLFTPLFGFSAISSPEESAIIKTIREGNWHYTRKVVTGASVSPITMQRGVYFADSDFYRWITASIYGDPDITDLGGTGPFNVSGVPGPTPRRNLVLVHFFSRGPSDDRRLNAVIGGVGLAALAATNASGVTTQAQQVATGAAAANSIITGATNLGVVRIPAKAWLLVDCLPTRYKAASDFDASSSAISLQELDIEYERFDEIALAA